MEIHICLWNEVPAFNFSDRELDQLRTAYPNHRFVFHQNEAAFLHASSKAEGVITWEFRSPWYANCPALKWIMTPAAGDDWVEPDPARRVSIIHGSFHGRLLAESLLSALLFMNHRMPAMIDNFKTRGWDRTLQTRSRLLAGQTVLIIGYGNIGQYCGSLIRTTGARVIGVAQTARTEPETGDAVYATAALNELLPLADHLVLLLPGSEETDAFLDETSIRRCKPGVFLYNFGRGNALRSADLIRAWDHIGGAFLDVTDEEPLPADSQLWSLDNIMITPHSSCIFDDYRAAFLDEVAKKLAQLTQ